MFAYYMDAMKVYICCDEQYDMSYKQQLLLWNQVYNSSLYAELIRRYFRLKHITLTYYRFQTPPLLSHAEVAVVIVGEHSYLSTQLDSALEQIIDCKLCLVAVKTKPTNIIPEKINELNVYWVEEFNFTAICSALNKVSFTTQPLQVHGVLQT